MSIWPFRPFATFPRCYRWHYTQLEKLSNWDDRSCYRGVNALAYLKDEEHSTLRSRAECLAP